MYFNRAHILPRFQLLHVLRDGRDIAFSVNQGPVEKFYASMYGNSDVSTVVPLKAMRLWSDWNSQIYHWAKARSQKYLYLYSDFVLHYLLTYVCTVCMYCMYVLGCPHNTMARTLGTWLSTPRIW